MSKRKRRVSRKTLGRRYQSDFINVSQRPRALIIDPICSRCRGRPWLQPKCRHCRGTGKDPEGDKWFDNHDRVKSTIGPKHQKGVPQYSTWVTKKWDPEAKVIVGRKEEYYYSLADLMKTCLEDYKPALDKTFIGGWRSVERQIPTTKMIGAMVINKDGHVETAAKSAIDYTWANLPRRKAAEAAEKEAWAVQGYQRLNSDSPRIQVMDHFDKFVTIRRDAKSWLRMFFAGDRYIFEEVFDTYSKRSDVYTGAGYVKQFKDNPDRIRWVQLTKLRPDVEAPKPVLNLERMKFESDE